LKPGISRESTSFTSPEGERLCFTKLPFGHHLSSAMFLSVMNRVFGPMRSRGSLCYYIDDCIIHTISAELQIQKIDEFLCLLIENDLKCSVAKSHLMATSIKYLGVCIDKNGINVPKEITRTLDKLESAKLTTPKQVMALLGYFNFWKNHIANLAQRTYHLRQLTKKNVPFRFTTECQAERSDVINCLRSTNTLQAISPNEPLWCFVDSSYKGIGVTWAQTSQSQDDSKSVEQELTQIRRGHPTLKPVLHQSWTIGPGQRSYGSTHLELFGLQKSIMAIEHLTTARVIHVVSDNVGVVALQKLKIGNARQRRLLAYLQLFDLRLDFCPVKKHAADFSSRLTQIDILSPGETIEWLAPDKEFLDEYLFAIHSDDKANNEDSESQYANGVSYMHCTEPLRAHVSDSSNMVSKTPIIDTVFASPASFTSLCQREGPVTHTDTIARHVTNAVHGDDTSNIQTSSMNVHAQSFYPASPPLADMVIARPTFMSECNIALTSPGSSTSEVGQTSETMYSQCDNTGVQQVSDRLITHQNHVCAVKRLRRNAATATIYMAVMGGA
jgi:Reverse transcriptase (RNA-dependent DNA polymerase)/RNase H-like domain found in reverse transcriptase